MRIALIGTRGVPARYGGFETAVEEIGRRLVERGHQVLVFCRGEATQNSYLGMDLVHLGALPRRSLETLSHTAASVLHPSLNGVDAAFVFNAANAPLLPVLRARRIPFATHVDGLEWKRAKWGPIGQRYYRFAESLSVRWSNALIADADAIADYYRHQFGVPSRVIAYGAPLLDDSAADRLAEIGLEPREYHLVVARFEPENHVLEIVKGYVESPAARPLVVVGSAPYSDEYTAAIRAAADDRVRLLGGVWDAELLNQLYANALSYLHGHSVGGTNPSLLRAAGAAAPTVAYDCNFNHEVIGEHGRFFATPADLAAQVAAVEADPAAAVQLGRELRTAATRYDWDSVTDEYERLANDLAAGALQPPKPAPRRNRRPWPAIPGTQRPTLVAHPTPDLYGSDRVLLETVSALVDNGEPVVAVLPHDGPLVVALQERGAEVRFLPSPVLRKSALSPTGLIGMLAESARFLPQARALLSELRPRTVLVNTVTIPLWQVVARLSRVPVAVHVHEAEASQAPWVKRLLYAPLLLADRLIVNSRFSLAAYTESWPMLRRRSTLVYNGVPGPQQPPTPPRETPQPVRLLFLGRLSPRKGPDVAIAAVKLLRERGVDVRLGLLGAVFPGYEWFQQELLDAVTKAGLGDRVEFHGFEPSIWQRVDGYDIVLVPSTVDEPFGNTAVEAMLAQRPLVVSATSGLLEAAAGFSSVRSVPPADAKALADAVQSMLWDWPAVRRQVAQDQRSAQARFGPQVYHRAILAALGREALPPSSPREA